MKKDKENELFYVGLKDPLMLRRSLLEATKDIVVNLKRYESLMVIRDEKSDEIDNLKSLVREIIKLISRLRVGLPKTGLREKHHKKPVKVKSKGKASSAKVKKEEVKVPKKMSDLEKLEKELGHIENKLSGLV